MAVQIIVEKGPDKGKSLLLDARAEMRLGRGPGNHLMVQDPDWEGTLRVSFSQGVCKVTNQTPTTIYLGAKTFTPGEQRVWFHGEALQPTAQTLLVLYVEEGTREGDAEGLSKSHKQIQLVIALLCLPLAGVLFFLPSNPSADQTRTPEEQQKERQQLEMRLKDLRDGADRSETAGRVLTLLKQARFEQLRKHPKQAFALYRRVCDEVESDLGGPLNPRKVPENVDKTLRDVRVFVNQELIALGSEVRK